MQFQDFDTFAITLRRGQETHFDQEHPYILRWQKFTTLDGGVLILCTSDRPNAIRSYLDSCPGVLEYMDSGGIHRNKKPQATLAYGLAPLRPVNSAA